MQGKPDALPFISFYSISVAVYAT